MKIRNKKTGEGGFYLHTHRDHKNGCLKVAVLKDGKPFSEFEPHEPIYDYDSLAELNAEWEDAPEEVKSFEEAAKVKKTLQLAAGVYESGERARVAEDAMLDIADIDYYEILPDGTKKTKFTWDEAMEIKEKTNGKWRVPTQAEWFAIAAAFGADREGKVTGEILAKNLGLTTDEDGDSLYWSSTPSSYTSARVLRFHSTNVYPQGSSNKPNGFTVRCVRSKYE